MPDPGLFAAIDLGSNSFHMLVARREHGELRVIDRLKDMIRLAGGVDDQGHLNAETHHKALASLARFGQRIADIPRHQVRAVGTQAFRQLDNLHGFLVVAETALGCPIDIISGREEARLVYLGVCQATPDPGRRLVIDIGGGSTELVIGEGPEPLAAESIPFGCVGMMQHLFADGRLTRKRWKQARQLVQTELLDIEKTYRELGWQQAIGSSGTLRALESMSASQSGEASRSFAQSDIEQLRELILKAGHVDALDLPGLSVRRRPVIAGGMVIIEAIMQHFDIESLAISPHALREGVLHDLLGRLSEQDPRLRSIEAMALRYQCDRDQAERVRDWAMQAAEQITGDSALHRTQLEYLDWSARLHELGLAIAHDRHHLHGAYIVKHADLPGFSHQEQQFMATLIGCHRGKLDPSLIEQQAPRHQQALRLLIAALRLAVTVCRARRDADLPDFGLALNDRTLTLRMPSGWLESHPLTMQGLLQEKRQLGKLGFDLELRDLPKHQMPTDQTQT
ncbi:Ppx/GppA family phosphatase [Wenzhouxiangella sp. AB-CW3]|uniref:Ppx/GppA phosphatase family protein n=1 Tax=Wenzhouxiangella sp. AB-CW3 TaxID=2771012 RepID=UPI00168AFE33|nr:Ppx/GppA phosphatase family protein [Wenzhouxiangella sp. AB-CW3]QOC21950.1 Ppx/GppA family phosphatase [Wenzhouxiangella sp. AB-CW3]